MLTKMKPSVTFLSADDNDQQKSIFNQSFYRERLGKKGTSELMINSTENDAQNDFSSYEYVKKYFENTNIHKLICKAVKTTLQSAYLPKNPYNVIGRLLTHESLYENMKKFYGVNPSKTLDPIIKDKYIATQRDIISAQINRNQKGKQNSIFKKIIARDTNAYVSVVFQPYVDKVKIHHLNSVLLKGNYEMKVQLLTKKHNIDIFFSIGGSLMLKVGCPYTADSLVKLTCFIVSEEQEEKSYSSFGSFILDDFLQIQNTPDVILNKLALFNEEDEQIYQWSPEQIIRDRSKILKQLRRSHKIQEQKKVILHYLMKVKKQISKQLGQEYLAIEKQYVLIQRSPEQTKYSFHTQAPFTPLMRQVFLSTQYFELVTKNLKIQNNLQFMVQRYAPQQFRRIVYFYRIQNIQPLCWSIFYSHIYQPKVNQQLLDSLIYELDSPVSYLDQLVYKLRVARMLALKSSATQIEVLAIIQYCDKIILKQLQKAEFVYPDSITFFQIIRKLTSTILDNPSIRANSILTLLQTIIPLMKQLSQNFSNIAFVLQGYLNNYMIQKDNQWGTAQSNQIFAKQITYDKFIRNLKGIPEKTLSMFDEVQKYVKQLSLPQSQVEDLLITKYITTYGLYDHIYNFYWGLICGKKINYPMSKFLVEIKHLAIKFQYEAQLQQQQKAKKRKKQNQVNSFSIHGVEIYDLSSDSRGQNAFYSFDKNSLNAESLKDYSGYHQMLTPLILETPNYNTNYIFSVKCTKNIGKWEESSSNTIKFYIDIVLLTAPKQSQLYRIMYNQVMELMDRFDKNQYDVLGVFIGTQQIFDQQNVLSWSPSDSIFVGNWIKYDYKSRPPFEKTSKVFLNCQRDNAELQVKLIHTRRSLLKSITLVFNIFYKVGNNAYRSFYKNSDYMERVFYSRNDILDWAEMNSVFKIISSSKKNMEVQPNKSAKSFESHSLRLLAMGHLNVMQLLVQSPENTQFGVSIKLIRRYSPFYTQLQQSVFQCENLVYLIRYLKNDRRGRQELKNYTKTIDILQYHILDRCIIRDRYVHSQGLSVTIINLLVSIRRYFDTHSDNNGTEWELIYLEKLILNLMGCLRFAMISCGVQIAQAIRSNKKRELENQTYKKVTIFK